MTIDVIKHGGQGGQQVVNKKSFVFNVLANLDHLDHLFSIIELKSNK